MMIKRYYLNVNDEAFIKMSIDDYIKLKDVDHLVNKSLKEKNNDVKRKLKEKKKQNIFSNES